MLAGVIVFLGVLWALWGACWLRRVELRRDIADTVRTLGLVWGREGLGPSVRASGCIAGRPIEVQWRRGFCRDGRRVRIAGRWVAIATDEELRAVLTGAPAPPSE